MNPPEQSKRQVFYEDEPKKHQVDLLYDFADGHLTPVEEATIRMGLLTNIGEPQDPYRWMS